jgi:cytochrome bd-type quinol oxidase subunit 2
MTQSRIRIVLAFGLLIFIGGGIRDTAWHTTHDTQKEFETASTQAAVHWLLWAGALVLTVAAWLALRELGAGRQRAAARLTLASGGLYAVVSVWHFIEHANGSDPNVAHVVLYLASAGLIVGSGLAVARLRLNA